jgi:malate dehydrogenase
MDQEPLIVAMSGAAGQIGYQLVPLIARGEMFPGRKIDLRLLEVKLEFLNATLMEIEDGAYKSLVNVTGYEDPNLAF